MAVVEALRNRILDILSPTLPLIRPRTVSIEPVDTLDANQHSRTWLTRFDSLSFEYTKNGVHHSVEVFPQETPEWPCQPRVLVRTCKPNGESEAIYLNHLAFGNIVAIDPLTQTYSVNHASQQASFLQVVWANRILKHALGEAGDYQPMAQQAKYLSGHF